MNTLPQSPKGKIVRTQIIGSLLPPSSLVQTGTKRPGQTLPSCVRAMYSCMRSHISLNLLARFWQTVTSSSCHAEHSTYLIVQSVITFVNLESTIWKSFSSFQSVANMLIQRLDNLRHLPEKTYKDLTYKS